MDIKSKTLQSMALGMLRYKVTFRNQDNNKGKVNYKKAVQTLEE
jgi:hypothetical protein